MNWEKSLFFRCDLSYGFSFSAQIYLGVDPAVVELARFLFISQAPGKSILNLKNTEH
jgi:hypothetical protein